MGTGTTDMMNKTLSSNLQGIKADSDMEYFWYAVYVRSRHEFRVHEQLTDAHIDTFLPTIERQRRWKDRKKLVAFPLFPGYLFVHIPENKDNMLAVLKTHGVVRFLSVKPGKPDPVPDIQITSLKKMVENKEALEPYPYLKEGQRVRMRSGPLAGVEGVLKQRRGHHILVLSVDILQQGASAKVDASEVEPA